VPLTGMTDLQYIAEALSCEDITREAIFERIGEISARYFCEIERAEFHVFRISDSNSRLRIGSRRGRRQHRASEAGDITVAHSVSCG